MPKKQRISRADFNTLSKGRSKRFFGLNWTLSAAKSEALPASLPRCAFVVSKKVAAHAVDRNRIKRIGREVCRLNIEKDGHNSSYIFYAKKEARDATFKQHESDIQNLVSQARLLPR